MPNLEKAFAIWQRISENPELKSLEKDGFARGETRGKSMNVPLRMIIHGLQKQIDDVYFVLTSEGFTANDKEYRGFLKTTLADLRNVAGCLFLKLQEEDAKNQPIKMCNASCDEETTQLGSCVHKFEDNNKRPPDCRLKVFNKEVTKGVP